jgi:putative protein kinase ArgK-like GTPase of G3E family
VRELVDSIESNLNELAGSGRLRQLRLRHLQREALDLIAQGAQRRLRQLDRQTVKRLIHSLGERRLDPASVAAQVLALQGK